MIFWAEISKNIDVLKTIHSIWRTPPRDFGGKTILEMLKQNKIAKKEKSTAFQKKGTRAPWSREFKGA